MFREPKADFLKPGKSGRCFYFCCCLRNAVCVHSFA